MKILTGFAVVKDAVGNRVTYTYSDVDESGTVVSSNNKESFIAMEQETKDIIIALENKINARLI